MPLHPEALAALRSDVAGSVTTDPEALARFSRDASPVVQMPMAAVAPRDREAVVALVRWARRWKIPLIARGGGSSLEGESVPTPGSVTVDLSGWNQVVEIDRSNRLARVGPGVVNRDLHRTLAADGLFFPPNPGSWTVATIGGNVATNASGPRSFRYGPTRSWVCGLEAVLGTGEVLRLGHRARKSSAGPGLLGFLVGSEGTLGIFTEITLTLAPVPERRVGLVVPVPEALPLGNALARLGRAPAPTLSAIEYLDRPTARVLSRQSGGRLPEGTALLLLELESSEVEETSALDRLSARLGEEGFPDDARVYPDADQLWTLRGESGTVLDREVGPRVREDVAVPVSRIDELLVAITHLGTKYGVPLYLYGHLGDGSLHPNFVLDPLSAPAQALRRELLLTAKRLGGTISAEHGIGYVKAPYLALEHGPTGVELLRSVRRLCDPDGILNPGKLYPPSAPDA